MADDITNAILRQMSEKLGALETIVAALGDVKTELRQFKEETGRNLAELRAEAVVTNQRLALVDQQLIDVGTQLLLMGRYVKNFHSRAILELRKRVGKLEKKVG